MLSAPDKEYMLRIMEAVPYRISKLYFLLVFPRDNIQAYASMRNGSSISIENDDVRITDEIRSI